MCLPELRWLLTVVVVAGESVHHLDMNVMDAERDKREAPEKLYFKRFCPGIRRIFIYSLERLIKKKLGEKKFSSRRHIVQNSRGIAVGIMMVHLLIESRQVHVHIEMDKDVASGHMTLVRREKNTQQYCVWLRPRDLEGSITHVRTTRHGCTLAQAIYLEEGTYK